MLKILGFYHSSGTLCNQNEYYQVLQYHEKYQSFIVSNWILLGIIYDQTALKLIKYRIE